MRISSPEVLIAASCVLLCMGNITAGSSFALLGILGAIIRTMLEVNDRIERMKREQASVSSISGAGRDIVDALSKLTDTIAQKDYKDGNYN